MDIVVTPNMSPVFSELTASIEVETGECGLFVEKRFKQCLKVNNIKKVN
jgi:hypothetical protein